MLGQYQNFSGVFRKATGYAGGYLLKKKRPFRMALGYYKMKCVVVKIKAIRRKILWPLT